MVHRNLPARRTDIFRPHLQIELKTTAQPRDLSVLQTFMQLFNNLRWSVMLTRPMSLPGGGLTTSQPSMLMPTRIHAAYLGPPPYLSGPTPGNTSRSHKIHTWHCTRGRMNASKICLLWPNLTFSRPGIRRAKALRIFIFPTGAPGVPFTHVP